MTVTGKQSINNSIEEKYSNFTSTIPSKYQRIILNKDFLKKGNGSPNHKVQISRISLNPNPIVSPKNDLKSPHLAKFIQPSQSSLLSKMSTNDQSDLVYIMRNITFDQDDRSKTDLSVFSSPSRDK